MTTDPILDEMATELRDELIKRGINPGDHPPSETLPSRRAYEEYRRRGGKVYEDADKMGVALVERVKEG
jgi:acyl-CoA-binding protein